MFFLKIFAESGRILNKVKNQRKTLKNLKSQYMHRNTVMNTISCVPVQDIGKGMKKESKKVKKDWKKVLTKGR